MKPNGRELFPTPLPSYPRTLLLSKIPPLSYEPGALAREARSLHLLQAWQAEERASDGLD